MYVCLLMFVCVCVFRGIKLIPQTGVSLLMNGGKLQASDY